MFRHQSKEKYTYFCANIECIKFQKNKYSSTYT